MATHRGFKDEWEHDEHIISKWNSIITKRDTVWILGDITMEKSTPYYILDRLNGIKKVVLGNHDQPQHVPELLKYVNHVCAYFEYKGYIFSHIPIHPSEVDRYIANIHGHNHEESILDNRYFNVACEQIGYTPILFDEIKAIREYQNTH